MAKSCPPPDTCKATVGRDQMGDREMGGKEMVARSVVLSTQGSLLLVFVNCYGDSTPVDGTIVAL